MNKKHTPERTCVACGKIQPKQDLVRLVNVNGSICVDLSKRTTGRGAYLCRTAECWEIGLKGKRIEKTLHTGMTTEDRERLYEYSKRIKELTIGENNPAA